MTPGYERQLRTALREKLAEKLHDVTGLSGMVAGDVLIFEDCLTLVDGLLTDVQLSVGDWCNWHQGMPEDCRPESNLDACVKERFTYIAIPPEVFMPPGVSE
jgi:hypothetical protein